MRKIETVNKSSVYKGLRGINDCNKKADNGSRTRLSSLGSWRSTDEQYLHTSIITLNRVKNQEIKNKIFRVCLLRELFIDNNG